MQNKRKAFLAVLTMTLLGILASPLSVFAAEAEEAAQPALYATFWALVPPVVAIALALITKEVYSSLFLGILVGGLLYSGFSFEGTVTHIFQGGIISVLSDSYNVGILIFLVILGAMVCMMNKAGGSAAFGRWAGKRIKTRVGAELATIVLGVLIFIDDYFNCLTVGSVMRPVTYLQRVFICRDCRHRICHFPGKQKRDCRFCTVPVNTTKSASPFSPASIQFLFFNPVQEQSRPLSLFRGHFLFA